MVSRAPGHPVVQEVASRQGMYVTLYKQYDSILVAIYEHQSEAKSSNTVTIIFMYLGKPWEGKLMRNKQLIPMKFVDSVLTQAWSVYTLAKSAESCSSFISHHQSLRNDCI